MNIRELWQASFHWLTNDGWRYTWGVFSNWFEQHGWGLIFILIFAFFMRRYGTKIIGKFIIRSINRSRRFENDRDRKLRSGTIIAMLNSVLKITLWLVVGTLILSQLGILSMLAPLLAGAGVLSLLLGFGIQTFVKDFITGMFIVSENQYRVGDIVAITTSAGGTVEGRVINISMRTTELRDDEGGAIHFIPNGNITRVANLTLDYAKINIEIKLPIDANFEQAEAAINRLGQAMSKTDKWERYLIQTPYYHGVQKFDNENVTIEVRAKTIPAEQWSVSSELQKRLAKLLADNDFVASKAKNKK